MGVSSYQLDERNRGFSYLGENTLDMRMDKTQELTARDVVNNYPEEKLANIIYEYGGILLSFFTSGITICTFNICKYIFNRIEQL